MAILNYTTEIDSKQTIAEIQARLVKFGAESISIDYRDSQPVAMLFCVPLKGASVGFRLPTKYEGVREVLKTTKFSRTNKKYLTEEHARNVAWRIAKDWVEAQLAIVEAGLAELPEVFLGYAIMEDGRTAYELAAEGGIKLLRASGK